MALIKRRLDIDPVVTPGKTGQFDVMVNGNKITERGGNFLTRKFGAGYPDLNRVVDQIAELSKRE